MENGESTAAAARRETHEEAGAQVAIDAAFAMISIAHINQIHLFYRGHLTSASYCAGEESLEVALFRPEAIPWEELSFRSVRFCLEVYLRDRRHREFGFYEHELLPES